MRAWAFILALAFILRLGWAMIVPVDPVSDSAMYDIFAREIAAGHGYMFPGDSPTAYWPVGPAALYGGLYAIFGTNGWVVAGPNILMGVATVWLVGVLGQRAFNEAIGLLAGFLVAIWPVWIQFTTVLSSEIAFVLLICAALIVHGAARMPWALRTVVSTALLVGAAFMRPTAIPLIVILPLFNFAMTRSFKRTALELAIALSVATALFSPWALRNQGIFGAPVLVSANFGANLWMGNNPESTGGYMAMPSREFANEVIRDNYYKDQAVSFIKENPSRYIALCVNRVWMSFGRETIGIAWNKLDFSPVIITAAKLISSAYWLMIFALAIIGVARYILQKPMRLFDPLIFVPAMFTAVAILVVGQDRYHVPLTPFVAIFAAFIIFSLMERWKGIRKTKAPELDTAIAN